MGLTPVMPLRILHVIQSVNPLGGGPIEAIRQIAASHHALGDTLQIASLDPPGAPYLAFPGIAPGLIASFPFRCCAGSGPITTTTMQWW